MFRPWGEIMTIVPCSHTAALFLRIPSAPSCCDTFPGSVGIARHSIEHKVSHRFITLQVLAISSPGCILYTLSEMILWLLFMQLFLLVFSKNISSGGMYNNRTLGESWTSKWMTLNLLSMLYPLIDTHLQTDTPKHGHMHKQPADVIYFTCTCFFKSRFVDSHNYKNLGFKFLLQKSEHLALLHPNFSIATISWSCRSQPSGVQPWLHNRITWGPFPKNTEAQPHGRPIKASFATIATAV